MECGGMLTFLELQTLSNVDDTWDMGGGRDVNVF